jgi:GNAT superfamily N-acetyltransferase
LQHCVAIHEAILGCQWTSLPLNLDVEHGVHPRAWPELHQTPFGENLFALLRVVVFGLAPETERQSMAHDVARKGNLLISTDPDRLNLPLIHDFLANRSYWAAGRPLEVVRRSLENSLCFGLYERGRQIGLVRVVTDRATFAWLCDVFVLEEHRGQGLGKWLVQSVLSHPALQGLRRVLLGTLDAHGLYQKFGFMPLADPTRFLEIFRPAVYQEVPDADDPPGYVRQRR